jgi:hypothetical protein
MKKIVAIVGATIIGFIVLAVVGWCIYALTIPEEEFAAQSYCSPTLRTRAINSTRHFFHAKTGAEMDADYMKIHSHDGLGTARRGCSM